MFINPVHRTFVNLVWWPSIAEIRAGAHLLFAPLRRSWLLRQGLLWGPPHEDLSPVDRPAVSADRAVSELHAAKRRIWPADWPAYIVKIEIIECDCPPPLEPPARSLLDLFI